MPRSSVSRNAQPHHSERITPVLLSAGGLDGSGVEARIEAGEALYVPIEALYAGEAGS